MGYTDSLGQFWAADNSFSGGRTYLLSSYVNGTPDPSLYTTERRSSSSTSPFQYLFSVANSTYTLKLRFSELEYGIGVGQRVFNVSINGQTVLTNFDVVAQGGSHAVVEKQFSVPVTNGQILVVFTPVVYVPFVNTIEIR